jgi:hypothetical protein
MTANWYKSPPKCIGYLEELWGTVSISNTEILERFQSKALRMIVGRTLVCAEYGYAKGSPNANSSRRNPPLQLSI